MGFYLVNLHVPSCLSPYRTGLLPWGRRVVFDVVYIDFSKAFDSVVHSKLCLKLNAYGFGFELFDWIKEFLSSRSQLVLIDSCLSSPSPVLSGLPQGTVIGPLLFLLFINDLPDILPMKVTCKLFADDVKLYTSIVWQLMFSGYPCKISKFGRTPGN